MDRLKACPFCGGEARTIYVMGAWSVTCECGAGNDEHDTEAEAIAAWNHRTGDWQSIESAPRDGTPLMLYARRLGARAFVRVVGWYLNDLGWVELSFTGPDLLEPTHWQPLPAPPDAIEALPPSEDV